MSKYTDEELLKRFSRGLKRKMAVLGMSGTDLRNEIDRRGLPRVSQASLSRYRSGEVEPGMSALYSMAGALDISVDELIGLGSAEEWPEGVRSTADVMKDLSPASIRTIWRLARDLSLQERALARRLNDSPAQDAMVLIDLLDIVERLGGPAVRGRVEEAIDQGNITMINASSASQHEMAHTA